MRLCRTSRYYEAREYYRHPETGGPTHLCVARWPRKRTLEEEIQATIAAWDGPHRLLWSEKGRTESNYRRVARLETRLIALHRAQAGLHGVPAYPFIRTPEEYFEGSMHEREEAVERYLQLADELRAGRQAKTKRI